MKLELLHVPDCPNLPPMLERLAQVTDLAITTRVVESEADAAKLGMAGSPTLLINGTDPFATGEQCECGVSCRLYRDEGGRIVPAPSARQLHDAIVEAGQRATPSAVLSEWRTRAQPLDLVEKSVHQAILRSFATTGSPPGMSDLDSLTEPSARSTTDVLTALHEIDAVRLASDGRVVVAYPFSATPTRHRVRIADRVDVYAMCAIDALGISAMLGQDTLITSADVTTGQPITVTTTNDHAEWEPAEAVVFIGADAGGGPSADCCCNYLNFFADHTSGEEWTRRHPQIPGQILDQDEASALGSRLFKPLLAI